MMEGIREELKRIYALPEGTGIFLTSSESSANFIPILIAKALNTDKKSFLNILSTVDEIDRDVSVSAAGRYISEKMPIQGYKQHKHDSPIKGLNRDVSVLSLKGRDREGNVAANNWRIVEEALVKCQEESKVPILHSVFGSDTEMWERHEHSFPNTIKELNGL